MPLLASEVLRILRKRIAVVLMKSGEVEMGETEKVIEDLNTAKFMLCDQNMLTPDLCIRIGQVITDAITMLKEHETELKTLKEEYRVLLEQYDTAHKLITTQQKRIEKFESDNGCSCHAERTGSG